MDKKTLQGYILLFVIFIGYVVFQKSTHDEAKKIEEQKQEQVQEEGVEENKNIDAPTITVAGEDTVTTKIDSTGTVVATQEVEEIQIPEVISTIENEELKIDISSKGGLFKRVQLKNYKKYDSTALYLIDSSNFNLNYTFEKISTSKLDFKVTESSNNKLQLTYTFPEGGSFIQNYELKEGFLLDYNVELVGMDKVLSNRVREFDMDFGMKLHQQEKSYSSEKTETKLFYRYASESDVDRLDQTGDDEDELGPSVNWLSFKQKFFNSAFIFKESGAEAGARIEIKEPEDEDDESYLKEMTAEFTIPYNGSNRDGFAMNMYFGPNHYQTLKKVDVKLEKILPLGWGPIGWVNKFFIIPIFNWLNSFISNYGLIILILTILIKAILIFPMYKIYISSAKMKLLKPELDELKAKMGNNMQKMQQEQMKLYKKAGVNPFGGCLPQLVQFPILIAMFRFFPASIELRQQSFLWATDLSTYDSIWDFGYNLWPYGDHVSLFTLLMAGSTFLYTLSNSNMNAGINNQMKFIMYLMPIMLLFWFNNYASGLSYYYFLANMITFGQNYVFRKFVVDEDKLHRQMQANKSKKGSGKKSKFQQRLEDMAKQRGLDPKTMKPKK